MHDKPMLGRRKKFTKETTDEDRLLERWDQQVFFIMQKFPHARAAIADIQANHAAKLGSAFVPSEESLEDLANLRMTLI